MGISRKKMIEFLKGHFRYWTANSWNRTSSYAQNVKIYNWVPHELQGKAYEMLQVIEMFDIINMELEKFARKYNYRYQIYFNGRSNGYLVLYQGEKGEDGKIYVNTSGIDQNENFEEWDTFHLKERYKLVKDFDKTIEKIKKLFLWYCKNFEIVETKQITYVPVKFLKKI